MKQFFIQDWGTFPCETAVVVGMDKPEILAEMEQRGFHPTVIESFRKDEHDCSVIGNSDAFVWFNQGRSLLWIEGWLGDGEDLNTLVHETNHLVFKQARRLGMATEEEAQAYMQEYLFDNIRRRLCAKEKEGNKDTACQ